MGQGTDRVTVQASQGRFSRPLPPFRQWAPTAATVLCIVAVIAVTLSQLHPGLLLSGSTTTGGDNGGHYALPAYLRSGLLPHWQVTGWDPGWYDGFPLYTFYFLFPDLLVALVSHVIPYTAAFKGGTILGSVLLPVTAWAMGRLFGLRRAFPGALAALSLCFLFDYTYTIYGGNLFSTLAGEYSYSLSIALALLFLGLMAKGIRTGRYRGWAAVTLAVCIMSHVIPALYAVAGALVLMLFEMLPPRLGPRNWDSQPLARDGTTSRSNWRILWWSASTVGLGAMLAAFWWVPFGLDQSYANSMGYVNVDTFRTLLLPEADWWALVLAGLAAIVAVVVRSRFGILMGVLAGASALAVIFDPQASLYNTRFLPLWFLSIYLLVGWGIAAAVNAAVEFWRNWTARHPHAAPISLAPDDVPAAVLQGATSSWPVAAVLAPLVALLVALGVVVTPFILPASAVQRIGITPGANLVTNWSGLNYAGYEAQPAYSEYRAVVQTMEHVGATHGCGQAMWQYDPSLGRFGTTMALMLLPYWSNGCIGSMEGLLFESSTTTPYHFINQSELSVSPSDPMVGLSYSTLDVPRGVQHLQLLGVRYFMAFSPQVVAAADADPDLRQVASTGPWTSTLQGTATTTTWKIYEVLHSTVVTPLANDPAVEAGIGAGQSSWLGPSQSWYNDPSRWSVELAQSGPLSWPRVPIGDPSPPVQPERPTTVSRVQETDNSVSFHVSRVGTPVLVKVSYFPNWHVSGGTGPYRVTPNLMVVVPTSHDVVLHYGASAADRLGQLLTGLGVIGLIAGFSWSRLSRRRKRKATDGPAPAP
ncbi:MAG TPA: hypothetical protein VNG12_19430 [Acidimicrobiales bacterium]|nr:hypothetical protein [Acidimicrobiales bacterium]